MSLPVRPHPLWMRRVLVAAGIYNLAWGALVVAFPQTTLAWTGLDAHGAHALTLWQCVGMIVGVYGIGYWIASTNPLVHWPVVLVGFLGKIFGPIGALQGWLAGTLPASMFLTNAANDLVWLPFFALILLAALRAAAEPEGRESGDTLADAIASTRSAGGRTLAELSAERPTLVVFLRHFGCVFCREALADVAVRRDAIEKEAAIALVHMAAPDEARAFFERYGLADVEQFSDPATRLYRAFGLERANYAKLFSPRVIWRGLLATLRGHGAGKFVGDVFQMPGAFLVHRGAIVKAYRHERGSDRPDYVRLATCPVETCGSPNA